MTGFFLATPKTKIFTAIPIVVYPNIHNICSDIINLIWPGIHITIIYHITKYIKHN